ncbi:DUF4286 family protein [Arcicella sp. LKC2W]|uniref:DUF4286 family protein n=1 Tax=Arcicella sp. LKC2W TaxID=2984198 RepID=UPI002B220962|nr:DUF4286 family protein [Arcicella sp. LKC2W]MEA5460516.1 DUF4286 family protein [Arcicella sp. LKC2W]
MLIHNITYNIDTKLEEEFLTWMRTVHIPNVMKTGFPKTQKIMRLLTELDNGGTTFSVQYKFDSIEGFEVFENDYLDDLHDEVHKKYKGNYVHFVSLLEELD